MEKSQITLTQRNGVPRVDSRLLATQLGNRHKNTLELIDRYTKEIKRFGLLPFETEARAVGKHGGGDARYFLLNEDQAFFLLALSRNTERVVELKSDLIMAFREARYGYACQTLEAERRKASESGRQLVAWRDKKPRLHGRVAYLKAQMLLPFDLEDATNDSHQ